MRNIAFLISAFIILSGCQQDNNSGHDGRSEAVARAGKSYITREQVSHQLDRFDDDASMMISENKEQYQRLVESMALTRLMADKQYDSMAPDQKRKIDLSVQAYRDQILAKEYMSGNLSRSVPDRKAVEDYYTKHAEEFGVRNQYSLSKTLVPESCALKKKYLTPELDQKAYNRLLNTQCDFLSVNERKTASELKQQYPELPESLEKDKAYWVNKDGQQMILFVSQVSELPGRALSEVTAEIRKRLAPMYLKQSLKKARAELRKEIEFFE